jgi:hypothetical protein
VLPLLLSKFSYACKLGHMWVNLIFRWNLHKHDLILYLLFHTVRSHNCCTIACTFMFAYDQLACNVMHFPPVSIITREYADVNCVKAREYKSISHLLSLLSHETYQTVTPYFFSWPSQTTVSRLFSIIKSRIYCFSFDATSAAKIKTKLKHVTNVKQS